VLLKILTILLGVLLAATRGFGLLFPTKMRVCVTKMVARPPFLRAMGIAMFALAFLIFIALGKSVAGAEVIMLFLGIAILSGALMLTFWAERYAVLVDWFMRLPQPALRILYGIGFALGMVLILLGLIYY
jgi:hypothetical protein